jgi:3-hydroxybutyrate dehydrogenase
MSRRYEFPVERRDAVIAINLTAVFLAIRAALPQMLARDWGRIINIASVHGLVASVDKSGHRIQARRSRPTRGGAGDGYDRHHLQRDLPRMGAHAAGARKIDALAAKGSSRRTDAKIRLLGENSSLEFTTPEQLGALAAFLCWTRAAQLQRCGAPGGWWMDRAWRRSAGS